MAVRFEATIKEAHRSLNVPFLPTSSGSEYDISAAEFQSYLKQTTGRLKTQVLILASPWPLFLICPFTPFPILKAREHLLNPAIFTYTALLTTGKEICYTIASRHPHMYLVFPNIVCRALLLRIPKALRRI